MCLNPFCTTQTKGSVSLKDQGSLVSWAGLPLTHILKGKSHFWNFWYLWTLSETAQINRGDSRKKVWMFFSYTFFWRAGVCRPLLRLCRPFMIFEGCLDSIPEYCCSKLARYRLSHPSSTGNKQGPTGTFPILHRIKGEYHYQKSGSGKGMNAAGCVLPTSFITYIKGTPSQNNSKFLVHIRKL